LKDLETLETFRGRISKLAERVVIYLVKLTLLFELINLKLKKDTQQDTKDPDRTHRRTNWTLNSSWITNLNISLKYAGLLNWRKGCLLTLEDHR
jgi:hypothetical protein